MIIRLITAIFTVQLLFIHLSSVFAADLKSLKSLFESNYNNYYEPRFCGQNIARLIREAKSRDIDLSNSYVLKIVGGGFLETSAFYSREKVNKRFMLGYFHMVLVADNYVFDFDLYDSFVLPIENYIRLQFTPPDDNLEIYGISYRDNGNPDNWQVTKFDLFKYAKRIEDAYWKGSMSDLVDMKKVYSIDRREVF